MNRLWVTAGPLALLLLTMEAPPLRAHSLGIDPADLIETSGGGYELIVSVPPSLSHRIAAPELPGRCAHNTPLRGERGSTAVRFVFACDGPLTATDTLTLPWEREGVLLTVTWADGTSATRLIMRDGPDITVDLALFQAGSGSWRAAAGRYLRLGIEHILMGVDHLLFVLAVMLIVRGFRPLVRTITAFTVAHSITLALATLAIIDVPPGPVEAVIALSIVFVCAEIVRAGQGRIGLTFRYPWIVAFLFGLLHGLGFAGALAEIGLPHQEIPSALLFFNAGVEIGQLIFVVGVAGAIAAWKSILGPSGLPGWGWARALPVYAIGTVATYWFVGRAAAAILGA